MSGPRPAIRWSRRVRASVISSSTGPSNCTTSAPRLLDDQPGPPRIAMPAAAVLGDAPRAGHPQMRVDRRARPRSAATGACRPRRRTGPRARRVAPASGRAAKRGCGVVRLSGTRPSRIGRIRFAAWWMVSPSGTSREGTLRTCAQISPASSETSTSCPGTTRCYTADQTLRERRARRRGGRRPSRRRRAGRGGRRLVRRARGADRAARRRHRMGRRRGAARVRRGHVARAAEPRTPARPAAVADVRRGGGDDRDRPATGA